MGNNSSNASRSSDVISNDGKQVKFIDKAVEKKPTSVLSLKFLFESTSKKQEKPSKVSELSDHKKHGENNNCQWVNCVSQNVLPLATSSKKNFSQSCASSSSDINQNKITADENHLVRAKLKQSHKDSEIKQLNGTSQRSSSSFQNNTQISPIFPSTRSVVIRATTKQLLECLGRFVCRRCRHVIDMDPSDISVWLREVDRSLITQGWQEHSFIIPSSIVFVYMLCKEMLQEKISTLFEVQCIVLTCLYISYSYIGNEISYPLRPFLIETNRYSFWSRCYSIINKFSFKMLQINSNTQFFTTMIRELITFYPQPLGQTTHSALNVRNANLQHAVSVAVASG